MKQRENRHDLSDLTEQLRNIKEAKHAVMKQVIKYESGVRKMRRANNEMKGFLRGYWSTLLA